MRKASLIFILTVVVIDMLGVGLAYPILPRLIQQFVGGDASQAAYVYGVLAALYAAMQFLFAPLLGALSDRFGRRPVILIALTGLVVDYLILALAPNIWWFAVGRVFSGICGASFTTAGAYMADVTPPEKRAQSFGLIGAAFGFGFVIGPVIGGVLGGMELHLPFLTIPGIRLPFVAAAGLTFVNMLFGIFVLPESLKPENRRAFQWKQANPVGALLELKRYPSVLLLIVIIVMAQFAVRVSETTWVLYSTYRYGWDTFMTGISLTAVGIVFIIGQGVMTRVVVKALGERNTIFLGLTIAPIAITLYGLAWQGWMVFAIMPLGLIGWTVAGPAVQGMISRNVPANEQGLLQGALGSLNSLVSIFSPILWTWTFGYFVSPAAPFILPGAAFFGAAIVLLGARILAMWSLGRDHDAFKHAEPAPLAATNLTEGEPAPPEAV
jgi:DHA1 family tetracycline resistance protein-like MFS transporter